MVAQSRLSAGLALRSLSTRVSSRNFGRNYKIVMKTQAFRRFGRLILCKLSIFAAKLRRYDVFVRDKMKFRLPILDEENEQGSMILTMIVALGVLGILVKVSSAMLSNQLQTTSLLERRDDLEGLRAYVQMGISCPKTLELAVVGSPSAKNIDVVRQSGVALISGVSPFTVVGKYTLSAVIQHGRVKIADPIEIDILYALTKETFSTAKKSLFPAPIVCTP